MQEKHEVIKERLRFVRERMKAENVKMANKTPADRKSTRLNSSH